jgi:predicted N-acyltransferase
MIQTEDSSYSVAWLKSIAEVDRAQWDVLAKPLPTPFLEWEWLRQMEISNSTTAETGWLPHHLTVWSRGELIAAAPLYVKTHSAGEFVFDHAWANVAGRLKIAYYPKLVGMSPFTPMIGYRFLMASRENENNLTRYMVDQIVRLCRRYGLSGCSFLFVDPQWHRLMINHGFISWLHQSFAWQNDNFRVFDDYLATFNANQRHNIRRERQSIAKQEVELKIFEGNDIPRAFFSEIYSFYERTNDKFGPWGCKYLTERFFKGHNRNHPSVFRFWSENGTNYSGDIGAVQRKLTTCILMCAITVLLNGRLQTASTTLTPEWADIIKSGAVSWLSPITVYTDLLINGSQVS